jgi:hypothetical protein
MAYDPKDPADKKILQEAIDAALAELATEHEADIGGLKTKNKELLAKIKSGDSNPEEVARLEGEVERLNGTVKLLTKEGKTAATTIKDLNESLGVESGYNRKLLVDNGLNDALVSANVAKQFLPAAKALLSGQVTIKVDGETRVAMVGDKPLGEFVKTWSQGDDGKHMIAAAVNSGGNAPGSQGPKGNGKSIPRASYEAGIADGSLKASTFFKEGGSLSDV